LRQAAVRDHAFGKFIWHQRCFTKFPMAAKTALSRTGTITEGEHLIGEFTGAERGATLIVVGSVHGNEPGGAAALRKISRELEKRREKLRGRVYLLAGNTRALARKARFIDSDLNRHWTNENIARNTSDSPARAAEDLEQRELLKIFAGILETARDEVFALDLHSTSAEGWPFATVGDTMRNRHFAQKFPVTILLGIEEQLDGTMLEYLNNAGAVTFGFEGGQHDSPATAENHEALVWLALVNAGILAREDFPEFETYRQILSKASGAARILEVRHREAIAPGDEFEMNPGFENFDRVRRGQILAGNRNGAIRAPESGLILMPLYQKQGEDGFFIGREVAPFWLRLSAILRRLKFPGLVRVLPGVWRHPADAESLIVNTSVARFFPLQIFHLLGFRKRRWSNNQLIVSRRRHDTKSPFRK
jgi:succinylglutamate desuccinylase